MLTQCLQLIWMALCRPSWVFRYPLDFKFLFLGIGPLKIILLQILQVFMPMAIPLMVILPMMAILTMVTFPIMAILLKVFLLMDILKAILLRVFLLKVILLPILTVRDSIPLILRVYRSEVGEISKKENQIKERQKERKEAKSKPALVLTTRWMSDVLNLRITFSYLRCTLLRAI